MLAPDLLLHLRNDRSLVAHLVGVDMSPSASGRLYVDAFHRAPRGDADGYTQSILEIIAAEGVNVVIPGSDQEAFALSRDRDALAAAGAVVLTSPLKILDLIRDKQATYQALTAAGIDVPAYYVAADVDALQTAISALGYPARSVVVKPIAGRGGRGLRVIEGTKDPVPAWVGGGARETRITEAPEPDAMREWFADGPLMVMQPLMAPAYDVDVLAVKGKAAHALVRERRNPAGIPFSGNYIVPNAAIRDYCLTVSEAIGLDGLHDIDIMTASDGRPALLEINPRMSGSVVAAHAAGFPIVCAAIAAAIGVEYPIADIERRIEVGLIPRAAVERTSGRPA